MASEGKFFSDGEDPHPHAMLPFDGGLAWQDESCFREVGFPGKGLHLIIGEPTAVKDDG